MNIQIFSNNKEIITSIRHSFQRTDLKFSINTSVEEFFKSTINNPSNIFFIQDDCVDLALTLDFLKDIRSSFGSFPLIFVVSNKKEKSNTPVFLNVGVDKVLYLPFDKLILEDFIGKNLQRDKFLPIKYRNVPSGGIEASLTREIIISEITSEGISFDSIDFFTRGMILTTKLNHLLNIPEQEVQLKIISTTWNEEKESYNYYAEFNELAHDYSKKIRFSLKN